MRRSLKGRRRTTKPLTGVEKVASLKSGSGLRCVFKLLDLDFFESEAWEQTFSRAPQRLFSFQAFGSGLMKRRRCLVLAFSLVCPCSLFPVFTCSRSPNKHSKVRPLFSREINRVGNGKTYSNRFSRKSTKNMCPLFQRLPSRSFNLMPFC